MANFPIKNAVLQGEISGTPEGGEINLTNVELRNGINIVAGAVANTLVNVVIDSGFSGIPINITLESAEVFKVESTGDVTLGGALNIGHPSDTTLSRVSAGRLAVEGVNLVTVSSVDTLTNKTLTGATIGTSAPTTTALANTAALSGDLLFHWLANQQYSETYWGQDGGNVLAGSGNVTGNTGGLNLITGTTSGSSAVIYAAPVLNSTSYVAGLGQRINWAKTVIISFTAYSYAPITTNGTLRFCFGTLNANATALDARGVGIVCTRATSTTMNVKLEVHNGTTLTTSATLATVDMSSETNHRYTIASAAGTVYLFIDGVYVGSSTGGPSNIGGAGLYHKVMLLNGSDSTSSTFQVSSFRIFVKP